MAGSESGHLGKRKATAEHSGGGPSSWRGLAEESGGEDPLMALGSEIMAMILGKLDMRSVAVACLVSRGWQAIASSDRIWAPKMLLIEVKFLHEHLFHILFLIFS